MGTLRENRPVWYAVAWIAVYVIAVNIGDWLSEMVGEPNSSTSALLVVLSRGLIVGLARDGRLR